MPIYTIKVPGATVEVRANSPEEAQALAMKQSPSTAKANAAAQKRVNLYGSKVSPIVNSIGQGGSLGWADEVDAREAQAATAIKNGLGSLIGKKPEYTAQQMYDATMGAYKKQREGFREQRPKTDTALGILGGLLMPMGEIGSGGGLLVKTLKGAGLGAGLGALAGAGSSDAGQRGQGAVRGGVAGGLIAGAIPGVGKTLSSSAETVARAVNKATGGKIIPANQEAGKRIVEAMRKDGLTPDQIRASMNEWMKSGVTPQFLNLVGQNTKRLVRAAAQKADGEAPNIATRNEEVLAANLQDKATRLTRKLAPSPQSATMVKGAVQKAKRKLADIQYPEAYAAPVEVPNSVVDALSGNPGKAALRRARAAAEARRNNQQMAEIDRLLQSEVIPEDPFQWYRPPPETVSGGTLDRIKIAMQGRASDLNRKSGTADVAGGLFDRAADIDAALDAVPGLQPARQTYRGHVGMENAIDLGMESPFAHPDQFGEELTRLMGFATPEGNPHPVTAGDIQGAARQGVVQNIVDAIGRPAEGSTGFLNSLSGRHNNYAQVLGDVAPDQAETYQQGIRNLVQQLKDARFVNPNSNSASAARLQDMGLVDLPALPTSGVGMLMRGIDMLRRGATLTDQERAQILQLATQHPEQVLQALPTLPPAISQEFIRAIPGLVPHTIQIPASQ